MVTKNRKNIKRKTYKKKHKGGKPTDMDEDMPPYKESSGIPISTQTSSKASVIIRSASAPAKTGITEQPPSSDVLVKPEKIDFYPVKTLKYNPLIPNLSNVKFIFSPPGTGKSTFLKYLQNKKHPAGNIFNIRDADDLLGRNSEKYPRDYFSPGDWMKNYSGKKDFISLKEETSWDLWHQLCFARLIRLQYEDPNIGPILCGFMVGDNYSGIQQNFENFVGITGNINMQDAYHGRKSYDKKKIHPEDILIVSMSEEEHKKRGLSRGDRPVDERWVKVCNTNYDNLYKRWQGQIKKIDSLNILDTKLEFDQSNGLICQVSPPENLPEFLTELQE